ncbi:MAG TPA: hypothetical protein VFG69_10285 [Nannocystaceae bacterium]|nr:hypothetical protein [Nannocystaceae bacterium]
MLTQRAAVGWRRGAGPTRVLFAVPGHTCGACTLLLRVGLALHGVVACGPHHDASGPAPDLQSELVDLYLDEGIEPCAGQLDAYDRFIARAFDLYGQEAPPSELRVPVRVFREPPCPEGALSCVRNGQVRLGGDLGQYHELVHIVQGYLDGGSIASLQEGTAEGMAPRIPLAYSTDSLAILDPDTQMLFATSAFDVDYVAAGIFTRFLIERHGIDAFREFFRTMGLREQPGEIDYRREFEGTFGETLDEAWPVFLSEPRCSYDLWYCDQGTPIELPFVLDGIDCSDPDVIGYDGPARGLDPPNLPYMPMKIFHLHNDQPRTLTFELAYVNMYIGGCGDCSEQLVYPPHPSPLAGSSGAIDPPFDLDFQAGTIVLAVRQSPLGPMHVAISEAD